MILGHSFDWYVRHVRNPFIVITVFLIALEFFGRLPWFVALSLIITTPVSWLIKAGSAFIVGYRIGKLDRRVLQAMVGGGILGTGIGIVSIGISIFRRLTLVSVELFGVFGGFDVFFSVGSEIIIAAFFAGIGAVIAGAQLEEIKTR